MRNVLVEVLLNLISVNEAPRDGRVIELGASPPGPSIHPPIRHPPLLQSHRKNGKLLCETDLVRVRLPPSVTLLQFPPI